MDKDNADREKDCCARCRWTEVRARPYGAVEYLNTVVPDGMKICVNLGGVFENTSWLMGLQSFSYALFDQPDLIERAGLDREETARQKPLLLHGHIGEDLARRRFAVSDPEVLSAIRNHALGSARMSALDRLIYTADACSADRDFPQARLIRRAALADLAEGYREAVRRKIEHILETGRWLHPSGALAWNAALSPS